MDGVGSFCSAGDLHRMSKMKVAIHYLSTIYDDKSEGSPSCGWCVEELYKEEKSRMH